MGFEDPERTFWVDERVYEHMSRARRAARAAQAMAGAVRRLA